MPRVRTRAVGALLALAVALPLLGLARTGSFTPSLAGEGVVLDAGGNPVAVPVGTLPEGEPPPPGHRAPREERWADLERDALRDLDRMVLDGGDADGAVLAGTWDRWRYVWARDAAWVAAALAVHGRRADALRVLRHLQRLERARDSAGLPGWQARYLPDGSGRTPDDRGPQLDGPGWVLWATSVWASSTRGAERAEGLESLRWLVERAARDARQSLDPRTGLPGGSADYWELPSRVTLLGVAAPLLAGLRAAGPLLDDLALQDQAGRTRAAARTLDAGVHTWFGAQGYPRQVTGGGRDTAVAWLGPPFGPASRSVLAARDAAWSEALRGNGGVAPGADWVDDGIAWTPETAAFALSFAASGDTDRAGATLDWLERHRTLAGSLPEKVLPDGRPASVAPLPWTAAVVLLTLAELDGHPVPRPG